MNVSALPHRVTIINPDAYLDRYQDEVADFGAGAERLENVPAWVQRVQPRPQDEKYESGRDVTATRWHLILPVEWVIPGHPPTIHPVTISTRSRVEYADIIYEVDGDPSIHDTPRGPDHFEAILKNVTG